MVLLSNMRRLTRIAALGFLVGVAGCQSGGPGGVLDLGLGGGSSTDTSTTQKISAQELRAYCPRVTLRSGTAFYNTYERGAENDRDKIIYQASISDVTRSCTYGAGTITMNVAAAGKVVPGPVAKDGTISMPIRIAVLRGEEVLYSQLHKYDVSIAANQPATQFVFNDPNVTFETPAARNVQVFVGYDEGPAD
ncbi:hypothetical protein FQ775_09075 [Nitratireductor mangrovi]|uniref:Lipoprotein n=1 Tax=Nitratireductor mangrovi TaxID=2599600 RepID=A0A5B8KYG3_9HYPH|nr:hypothetical protein [Nitratireductor mangrovi]QDZ00520.1 hypothetical protein FQ775_09075 [Nitratireductor mangrovi]